MTEEKRPLSVIEIAIFIVRKMDIDADKPTPHDYGRLVSNLIMLRYNTPSEHWNEDLWSFFAEPEDYIPGDPNACLPERYRFLEKTHHYGLLMQALDDIYNRVTP